LGREIHHHFTNENSLHVGLVHIKFSPCVQTGPHTLALNDLEQTMKLTTAVALRDFLPVDSYIFSWMRSAI